MVSRALSIPGCFHHFPCSDGSMLRTLPNITQKRLLYFLTRIELDRNKLSWFFGLGYFFFFFGLLFSPPKSWNVIETYQNLAPRSRAGEKPWRKIHRFNPHLEYWNFDPKSPSLKVGSFWPALPHSLIKLQQSPCWLLSLPIVFCSSLPSLDLLPPA